MEKSVEKEDMNIHKFLADFSSDPHAAPVQLPTTGLLGAAAAQRAGKQLGTGAHASCRTSCNGGACAPGMARAMGGDLADSSETPPLTSRVG